MQVRSSTTTLDPVVVATASSHGVRLAWGAVWSGFLVAVGAFLLLSVLGLAVGVSAADVSPATDGNARTLGIGAAVWSGVSLLIALFVGGIAATRSGMTADAAAGAIEGVLIWVLAILTLLYMAGSGVGLLSRGVFGALGTVGGGAAAAVQRIDVSDLTSGDVDAVARRLADPKTIQVVASATGTSTEQARTTLAGITERVTAARADPAAATAEARRGVQELASQAGARVERAAAQAQPYATAAMWSTLIAMVVGLLAAIAGAMVGRRQVLRRVAGVRIHDRTGA